MSEHLEEERTQSKHQRVEFGKRLEEVDQSVQNFSNQIDTTRLIQPLKDEVLKGLEKLEMDLSIGMT